MITSLLEGHERFRELVAALPGGTVRLHAPRVFQGFLLAALAGSCWEGRSLLVVTAEADAAERLLNDMAAFAGEGVVLPLPPREVVRGSDAAPSNRSVGYRHRALAALAAGRPVVLVADAVTLLEKGLDPGRWPQPLSLATGETAALDAVIERLVTLGYERVDQVEDRGEFAVRGGIVDCFPSTADSPLRMEFFGDELESLRRFSPFTQKSLAEENMATIYAARKGEPPADEGGAPPDTPGHLPTVLVDRHGYAEALAEFAAEARDIGSAACYHDPGELEAVLAERALLEVDSMPAGQHFGFAATGVGLPVRRQPEARRNLQKLVDDGYRVFVFCETPGAAERARYVLDGAADILPAGTPPPAAAGAWLLAGRAPTGFISRELKLAVLDQRTLLGTARPRSRPPAGRRLAGFRDLSPGDYVVHEDHGIGVFDAVTTRTVAGVTRDYLHLRYRDGDSLLVPQGQLDKVTRYIGPGEAAPPLSKLGGKAWARARARARSAAREMAGELLQLYAARKSLPGHAFAPDGRWQQEMEAAFPYRETPDQEAAIAEVKEDMESPHPMDRLICGDVGFGKTEVALRAAFKAATQGKQVLMLVPTTILALQHYQTFRERFEPFPVKVEMLSRFRSPAEGRRIAREFSEGRIDVLIGTHRLLSADVLPRELGLVIIDEEQRFGVVQKERLRQLRLQVDVLSLTATPIPRTLQMSLSGVRDISVIETPPEGRNPIRTYVGEYDDRLVVKAVERELERGGSVFFLHNQVESIEEKAAELEALMPGVRFLVAHGRMPERRLESVMAAFIAGEADVLVCTSIIESGLDIPTVNTLIVDRADRLGLAQLYQIRGRIGRARTTAYAYLFYSPLERPTEDAMARLTTLGDYTELGSGLRIAMRDLEIRGAGDLLGEEQSGHVAAVGFEMYLDLLRRAVAELKQEPAEEQEIARLDADVDAYIPGEYVPPEAARIDLHRRIAAARSAEELERLRAELADRFGPPPQVVENLLLMQEVRIRATLLEAAAVGWRQGRLELTGIEIGAAGRERLQESGLQCAYHPLKQRLVVWPEQEAGDLSAIRTVIDGIIKAVLSPDAAT